MTDQDNLRDRIEQIIEDKTSAPAPDGLIAAQAIINEFGMTVETEPGHDPRECGCSSRAYPAESRIVGKWEVEQ